MLTYNSSWAETHLSNKPLVIFLKSFTLTCRSKTILCIEKNRLQGQSSSLSTCLKYEAGSWQIDYIHRPTIAKTAASLGLHDMVDLVACCHSQCCHAFLLSLCGAVSRGIRRGRRSLQCFSGCSPSSLCSSLALLRPVLTCLAVYCPRSVVFLCAVL